MNIFGFLRGPNINEGVKRYLSTPNAVLLDVRTAQEYKQGHIPGSVNLPLQDIDGIARIVENKSTPIFVHCLSGARSHRAVRMLKNMGYDAVENIGGISAYRGKVVS